MSDDRLSIAELQRMVDARQAGALGCRCEVVPGDRPCGVHLPPVLLEIAAAALELQAAGRDGDEVIAMMGSASNSDDYAAACTLAPRIEERRRAALRALDAALAKVRP